MHLASRIMWLRTWKMNSGDEMHKVDVELSQINKNLAQEITGDVT